MKRPPKFIGHAFLCSNGAHLLVTVDQVHRAMQTKPEPTYQDPVNAPLPVKVWTRAEILKLEREMKGGGR